MIVIFWIFGTQIKFTTLDKIHLVLLYNCSICLFVQSWLCNLLWSLIAFYSRTSLSSLHKSQSAGRAQRIFLIDKSNGNRPTLHTKKIGWKNRRWCGLICFDVAINSVAFPIWKQLNHAKSTCNSASRLLFCPLERNAPPKTNIEFERGADFLLRLPLCESTTFIMYLCSCWLNFLLLAQTANLL